MKSNKSPQFSTKYPDDYTQINPPLNDDFWNSLKNSIKMRKNNPSIKGRILVAKHILAPIIQDLMSDALEQMEIEEDNDKRGEETKIDMEEEEEEYKRNERVLRSEVKIRNLWRSEHYKKNTDSDKWAAEILRKISRDLEKPFDKVENSSKDALNENICAKLTAIHDHLGSIIERLKKRKRKTRPQNPFRNDVVHVYHEKHTKDGHVRQGIDDWENCYNTSLEPKKRHNHDPAVRDVQGIQQERFRRVLSLESLANLSYDKSSDKALRRESVSTTNLSDRILFEEQRNQHGKHEIIIKCLEDLEKVRNYLERLRNEEECEKPPFSGLENCNDKQCMESEPHLHSNLLKTPVVLKLNKHADENEGNNDLIIGLPGLTRNFPDFHVLLNRKKQGNKNEPKRKISKIPILIDRKRLNNKQQNIENPANFVIFDPADPCRSIIKMKEHKKQLVSNFFKHCNEENIRKNSLWPGFVFVFKNDQIFVLYVERNNKFFMWIFWKIRSLTYIGKIGLEFDKFDEYLRNLLDFTSILKGKIEDKKEVRRLTSFYLNLGVPKIRTYQVYFFSCFSDKNKEKSYTPPPATTWVYRSNNAAIFPLWTIKKSKYYNVPRNKKSKKIEDDEQKISADSIEKPKSEVQMQISKVSISGEKPEKIEEKTTDVKRKVSFRDEVEFSTSNLKRKREKRRNYSTSDLDEMEKNISDLLMTDSLMKIVDNIPKNKPKTRRKSAQNLNLTDSARDILAKLSRSFDNNKSKASFNVLETPDGRLISQFYDQNGSPITEVFDHDGHLVARVKSNNIDSLAFTLFDSNGFFVENCYNIEGKRIKSVYDANRQLIKRITSPKIDQIPETIAYYDHKDDTLKKLYKESEDFNGEITEKSRENLDSLSKLLEKPEKFFDKEGNPLVGVYDKKGKPIKITASGEARELIPYLFDKKGKIQGKRYDSKGRQLKSVYGEDGNVITGASVPWLNELLSSCDGLKKKEKTKLMKKEEFSVTDKFYDDKGNVINGVYDAKGKPVTTSNDSVKLIPILYDKNGKFIKKFYNVDGKKLRAVFDKDGNVISKISMEMLRIQGENDENTGINNEENCEISLENDSKVVSSVVLDANEEFPQNLGEKLEDFVQSLEHLEEVGENIEPGISSQILAEKLDDLIVDENREKIVEITPKAGESIYKFFDVHNKAITSVYDMKGRILTKTKSGNVDKLTSSLFDENGTLHREIFDRNGDEITRIFDEKGRIISRISMPTSDDEEKIAKRKKERKIRGSVYDEHGCLVREIYDKRGYLLKKTKMAKIDDLAPFIFDDKGVRRKVYRKEGYEIGPLYDYDGNLLKKTKKLRRTERKRSRIFSPTGRQLRNFYDSEGSLILTLYNDRGKPLCTVDGGDENADLLSDFFFDKYGHFIRGRFYDSRGDRIKHVYDSDENIVRSIRRTHAKKTPPKIKNNEKIRDEKKNFKNRDVASESDLNQSRDVSSYSLNAHCFSCPIVTGQPQNKFYDKYGNLLTGVYNSKHQVLGYSESGNVRVLAPYLFDDKGCFTRGRYTIDGKPLKRIYDRNGRLLSKISRQQSDVVKLSFVKNRRKRKFYDSRGKPIMGVYDSRGAKIFATTESRCGALAEYLFDDNGIFNENLYDFKGKKIRRVYDKNKEIIRKISPVAITENTNDSRRFPILSDLKDKILTVIFDNPKRKKITDVRKKPKSELYDESGAIIREIFDENGKKINRTFDSNGKICEFYTISGTLLKNNVMTSMFERNAVFRPKAYDSDGNMIETIYANEKLLRRVYDKNKNLAKVDSDPMFFNRKSTNENTKDFVAKKTSKQINYFSEGSKLALTKRRHQKQQVEKQQSLKEGTIANNQAIVSTNYTKSHEGQQGDDLVYEQCHRLDMGQLGMELKNKLYKMLPKTLFRSENDAEYKHVDSFEAMIDEIIEEKEDKAIQNSRDQVVNQNSRVFFDDAGKLPISRGIIENTLMTCVHLDSDTKVVGKVSNMVIQHFASLILQEIKGRFYEKLDALQVNFSQDSITYSRRRESVCIGTELKFEDSLIGKHSLVQTSFHSLTTDGTKSSGKSKKCAVFPIRQYVRDEFPKGGHYRTFVCKVPSLQPFVILMNKNI